MNNNRNISFAGFVITYNRDKILASTIELIFNQTIFPEKLLIIDNSPNNDTFNLIQDINDPRIEYFKTGENLGPAGAASIGLRRLAEDGFDWIYWGDDDDPPKFENEFEHLLNLTLNQPNLGAIGSVGSKFNFKKGKLERFNNKELKGLLPVETIGGNQNLIVSGKALRKSMVYPNKDLFFGFEEFEFLQRLKKSGYAVVVSGESLLRHRTKAGRLNQIQPQIFRKLTKNERIRAYYSYRNHIFMFNYTFSHKRLALLLTFKAFIKSFAGFKFGLRYGFSNSKFLLCSVSDGYRKQLGRRF